MPGKSPIDSPLAGRLVALPESRQLDVLAALFERRRARVLRVPLVTIHDSPHQDRVRAWLDWFIAAPPDILVLLTGEGLRRLLAVAERGHRTADFIAALGACRTLCRGPKPGRALKEVGLVADLVAELPTSAGIIAALDGLDLRGKRIGVQLYGDDPNRPLMDFLAGQDCAEIRPVAPYVYGTDSDARLVRELIEAMAAGRVDLIAFTSKPQVRRLFAVAEADGNRALLEQGLAATAVGAVGPIVREELEARGVAVSLMPETAFFMKPLVRAAEALYREQADKPGGGIPR